MARGSLSVGCFLLYQHLGLFLRRKQVWTYSDLEENKFALIKFWVRKKAKNNSPYVYGGREHTFNKP